MSQAAEKLGVAVGDGYDCERCGGRFRAGSYRCDVGHPDMHCHEGDEELSPPTLADHPQKRTWGRTESGLVVPLSAPGAFVND